MIFDHYLRLEPRQPNYDFDRGIQAEIGGSGSALVSSNVNDRSRAPWRTPRRCPTKPPIDSPT